MSSRDGRACQEVILFGMNVVITERDTFDTLTMIRHTMQNRGNMTPDVVLYQMAKVLEQGLKNNWENLRWYQAIWKIRYRKLKAKYLLKHLSSRQLGEFAAIVYKLEGIDTDEPKKKVKKAVKTKRPRT